MTISLAPDTPIALAENVAFRPVGETGILLNTVSGQIHTCNETARDVVALIDEPVSAQQLCTTLSESYDVTADDILPDVLELLNELSNEGMITPAA